MDGYGILVHTKQLGTQRYRSRDEDRWELTDAEALAFNALHVRQALCVSVGNGDHEFCLWREGVGSHGNFSYPGARWAAWYVDVEMSGHRWRYQPVAAVDDERAADGFAERAMELAPIVTHLWVGKSDGSVEYDGPSEV